MGQIFLKCLDCFLEGACWVRALAVWALELSRWGLHSDLSSSKIIKRTNLSKFLVLLVIIFRHIYNMGGKSSAQMERFLTHFCQLRSSLFTFLAKLKHICCSM